MEKREILIGIIEKMLSVEANSAKAVSFTYDTLLGINLYFRGGKGVNNDWIGESKRVYLDSPFYERQLSELHEFITEIEKTPDIEPNVRVSIPESKARELGLI